MKSNAEKDCYALIQQIALIRDPRCILCPSPSQVGHHVWGRGLAAAFHPEMVRGLCNSHHIYAHARPEGFRECMVELIGDRYRELEAMAREIIPYMDFQAKRRELREMLGELQRRAA